MLGSRLLGVILCVSVLGAAPDLSRLASRTNSRSNDVEHANYTVVESYGNIEIRNYPPLIVAQVEVSGARQPALNQGFRLIADYIFGNNVGTESVAMTAPVTQRVQSQQIAMTAPVTQQKSEKIAMTAPVTQSRSGETWEVRFVMPSNYTLDTLPRPNNDEVKILEIPGTRQAAIIFSGKAGPRVLAKQTSDLQVFLNTTEYVAISAPTYSYYDDPMTPPRLRHNEVMIQIEYESN